MHAQTTIKLHNIFYLIAINTLLVFYLKLNNVFLILLLDCHVRICFTFCYCNIGPPRVAHAMEAQAMCPSQEGAKTNTPKSSIIGTHGF